MKSKLQPVSREVLAFLSNFTMVSSSLCEKIPEYRKKLKKTNDILLQEWFLESAREIKNWRLYFGDFRKQKN